MQCIVGAIIKQRLQLMFYYMILFPKFDFDMQDVILEENTNHLVCLGEQVRAEKQSKFSFSFQY